MEWSGRLLSAPLQCAVMQWRHAVHMAMQQGHLNVWREDLAHNMVDHLERLLQLTPHDGPLVLCAVKALAASSNTSMCTTINGSPYHMGLQSHLL